MISSLILESEASSQPQATITVSEVEPVDPEFTFQDIPVWQLRLFGGGLVVAICLSGLHAGNRVYGMVKLDGIMDRIIRYQLGKVKAAPADQIIAEGHEKAIELARARCNIASKQIDEKQRELNDYEAETIKVIRGQSKLLLLPKIVGIKE